MSTASTMEQSSTRLDLGQRLFVFGVFAVVVAEALITIMNIGDAFDWLGCLFGIVATVGMLYLGNWLYTGSKTAWNATITWAGIFIVLAAVGMVAKELGNNDPAWDAQARHLGIVMTWQAWVKAFVYVLLLVVLLFSGATGDWLAHRRGETIQAAASPAPAAGSDVPVTLAAEHTNALEAWASALGNGQAVLLIVGAAVMIGGIQAYADPDHKADQKLSALFSICEGACLALIGTSACVPAKAIRKVIDASPRTMGPVMELFNGTSVYLFSLLMLGLALAAIELCRVLLSAM
jgi:hypothetical protein